MALRKRQMNNERLLARLLVQLGSTDGAVTTFLIIVTAGVVLFGTVLIDYARVAALNALAEHAVRTSVRSVLSAYDAALYERYGLFGRGGTPNETIFERSMRGTLEYGGQDERFRPVAPRVDRFQVEDAAYLGRYDVLERQILEEMKIKAPVDFMMEIGNKFASLSKVMKESAATSDALTRMSGLYDERQKHLLQALADMREAAKLANGLSGDSAVNLATGFASYRSDQEQAQRLSASIAAAEQAASVGASKATAAGAKAKASGASPTSSGKAKQADIEKLASLQGSISRYEQSLRAEASALANAASVAKEKGSVLQQSALKHLAEAQRLNGEIRLAAEQAEAAVPHGYDRVTNANQSRTASASASTSSEGMGAALQDIRKTADQLVYSDSWFTGFENEINGQASELAALATAAEQFAANAGAALAGYANSEGNLATAADSLKLQHSQFTNRYVAPGTVLAKREAMIQVNGAADEQRKQNEKEANALFGQTKQLIGTASGGNEGELLALVQQRYERNLQFNQASDETIASASQWADVAEAQTDVSNSLMGGVFEGVADMMEGTRNSLYVGEYVLNRFQAYSPLEANVASNGNGSANASTPATASIGFHAITFAKQEAEYVLYGLHNPSSNVAAAYAEIFGVRFAIRLMEGLIECRALGFPLLVLSGALVYAMKNTLTDLTELMERGSTKLSKYANIDMHYKDYLRVFMLLHGNGNNRLSRIAAVIETNTGTDLSRTPAAISGTVDVSMKLLFLPGAMKLLGRFGLLQGRVVDGRYETTKLAGLSY
ncbi:hypothetical protein [Paenibacillus sp. MMS18-CY102]|uniref:hypothetical protein n=1 Tax=Paenibacillus sp. MMS18-CY102 TaxID=2682849 RepID=UPI001365DE45|nr:hypothetical protein [Paenibacillus sp. MMS18-CY102]MWC30103.1 hypothetical protein [Paenibacillus sp. MMS18-CY102]